MVDEVERPISRDNVNLAAVVLVALALEKVILGPAVNLRCHVGGRAFQMPRNIGDCATLAAIAIDNGPQCVQADSGRDFVGFDYHG